MSGGALIIVMHVAAFSSFGHNNAASALSFLNVFRNIGAAVGGSISAAIWQRSLPQALARYLPTDAMPDLDTIYEDLATKLSYTKGTATGYLIVVTSGCREVGINANRDTYENADR